MTRDEILNMPVGMEMNVLMAVKVMGWGEGVYRDVIWWVDNDNIVTVRIDDWMPSENIAAAWPVVEKMTKCKFSIRQKFMKELQYIVTKDMAPELLLEHPPKLIAYKSILFHLKPKHICCAALLVMEVNNDQR